MGSQTRSLWHRSLNMRRSSFFEDTSGVAFHKVRNRWHWVAVRISNYTIPLTLQSMNHVQPNTFNQLNWWGSNFMKNYSVVDIKLKRRLHDVVIARRESMNNWCTKSMMCHWISYKDVHTRLLLEGNRTEKALSPHSQCTMQYGSNLVDVTIWMWFPMPWI